MDSWNVAIETLIPSDILLSFPTNQMNRKKNLPLARPGNLFKNQCPVSFIIIHPMKKPNGRNYKKKYPDVMSEDDIVKMFNPEYAVDLYYDVVKKKTEWPTNDYSIKTLASYLGFHWRDESPSGAESIEWYHRYIESGEVNIKKRILKYNEDDCTATRVLLDGIFSLLLL